MVIATAGGEAEETMTTIPERSRNPKLNNFSSLPCFSVKWGRQKQLRCVKDSSAALAEDQDIPTSSSSPNHQKQKRRRSSPDVGGIEAMREKLMLEYRTDLHQMKATILSESGGTRRSDDRGGAPRPWNLRSRRALCKEPTMNDNNTAGDRKPVFSAVRVKSPKRSGEIGSDGGCGVRPKFSSSLSKQEIEEDFLAILGTRPARRPKKRSRNVQKQIDNLTPGFWLSEITADMYKVNENAEAGKR